MSLSLISEMLSITYTNSILNKMGHLYKNISYEVL